MLPLRADSAIRLHQLPALGAIWGSSVSLPCSATSPASASDRTLDPFLRKKLPNLSASTLPESMDDSICDFWVSRPFKNLKVFPGEDASLFLYSSLCFSGERMYVGSVLRDFRSQPRLAYIDAPTKSSVLDPQSTWLLKDVTVGAVLPILMTAINVFLSSAVVSTCVKNAITSPLLQRPGLDPDDLRCSRLISNLPFIGKVMEKVVAH